MTPSGRPANSRAAGNRSDTGWRACRTLLLVLGLLAACSSREPTDSDLLRIAGAAAPDRVWSFVDRPDGERLLACATGHEAVRVAVDRSAGGRMTVARDDGPPIAIWSPTATFVRAAAIAETGDGWVRIDRTESETRRNVAAALGPSLSYYALADRLPASPRELVASTVAAASEIVTASQRGTSRKIRVDLDEARTSAATDGDAADLSRLTFTLENGLVAAVAARLEDDPDAFGFRWELDVGAPVVDTIPDRWIDSSSVTIDAQWESPPCEIGP